MIDGDPENNAGLPEIFCLSPYRQCPCQGLGQKWTMINYMKRNKKQKLREDITPGVGNYSCQDFLQTVKPGGEGLDQNNLEAYPARNFRL
jgi:hypothetical protein